MLNRDKRKATFIDNLLELPKEVTTNMPKLTIVGFNELLIENYKGILEYEDFNIRVNTYIGIINISGFDLELNQMTEDDILVNGRIESIELEKNSEE